MISEIPVPASHETLRFQPAGNQRTLPLKCPHCRESIQLTVGLCGNRLIDAILLQAERIGTELECQRCGLRFIFQRTRPSHQTSACGPERGSCDRTPPEVQPAVIHRMETRMETQPLNESISQGNHLL